MVNKMKKNIVSIIPARGGSKGLHKKNIKLLNGKPLICYTIKEALESDINRVIVSTDDDEIAKISKDFGAEVIKRSEELAEDKTPVINVVLHVLEKIELEGYICDIAILLQPTSPLRTKEDINEALKLFIESDCESLISVNKIEHSPYWSFNIKNSYLEPLFSKEYIKMRRQDLPEAYMPNGAIFISTPKNLKKYTSYYCEKIKPYIMSVEKSVDIDTQSDLDLAEIIIKREKKM